MKIAPQKHKGGVLDHEGISPKTADKLEIMAILGARVCRVYTGSIPMCRLFRQGSVRLL